MSKLRTKENENKIHFAGGRKRSSYNEMQKRQARIIVLIWWRPNEMKLIFYDAIWRISRIHFYWFIICISACLVRHVAESRFGLAKECAEPVSSDDCHHHRCRSDETNSKVCTHFGFVEVPYPFIATETWPICSSVVCLEWYLDGGGVKTCTVERRRFTQIRNAIRPNRRMLRFGQNLCARFNFYLWFTH